MKIIDWLKILSAEGGSDLYLSTGAPPCAKFAGELKPIDSDILQPGEIEKVAYEVMDSVQQAEFEQNLEMNLALSVSGYGRFRINVFLQRGEVGLVARNIISDIPRWQDLRLPRTLTEVILRKRGLVLFVGATGCGKSTSLASLLDYRNSNSSGHIVTIEDPVEFVHSHKKSIVNQREVGVDTRNWHSALKNALRQSPDVILIGEIRDRDTMEHALAFADTGRLCVATLHANNVEQALTRIVDFFPGDQQSQACIDLSQTLQCIVSQRLIPTPTGARCAAYEVLLGNTEVSERLLRREFGDLAEIMQKSESIGMTSLDSSLIELYLEGLIDEEEALRNADSESTVELKIQLAREGEDEVPARGAFAGFSLEEVDEGEFGPV